VNRSGIIADYNRNGVDDFKQGLDFNTISSAFNQFKPHAPVLGYGPEGYTIRIGQVTYTVQMVHGGSGRYQRFLVRLCDCRELFNSSSVCPPSG
jgi:hypothetical protein